MLDQASIDAHKAQALTPGQLFINGDWRESIDGDARDVVSPVDCSTLTSIQYAGVRDVDSAVTAARTAFDSGRWLRDPALRKRQKLWPRGGWVDQRHFTSTSVNTRCFCGYGADKWVWTD